MFVLYIKVMYNVIKCFIRCILFFCSHSGPRPVDPLTNALTSHTSVPPQSPPPGQNSSANGGGSTSSDGGEGDIGSDAEGRIEEEHIHVHSYGIS